MCQYHTLFQDVRLFALLVTMDEALTREVAAQGCPRCQRGRLHQSNDFRKPRGGPRGLPGEFAIQFSYCCDLDGCRRRMTPPSFRFLGRRVYLAAVFVLRSTATHGLTVKRASRLHDLTGVSLRTLKRWRVWWLEIFPVTSFWRGSKELLSPPVAATSLPQPVVSRFRGETLRDRLIGTLRFFLPLSTTSAPEPELVK